MNKRIGIYITKKISGESYQAYVPAKLPPEPPIKLTLLYPYLEKATLALAELNSFHKTIPTVKPPFNWTKKSRELERILAK